MTSLRAISRRTWTLAVAGVGSALLFAAASATRLGGDSVDPVTASLVTIVPIAIGAVSATWAALQFKRGEAVRQQWLLIAIALDSYLCATLAWSYYEVIAKTEVPVPGLPDLFYIPWYLLVGAALILAIRALSPLFNPKIALLVAFAASAVGTMVLWIFVLGPSIDTAETSLAENAINVAYPIADLMIMLPLGASLAYLTSRLGSGRLALPWRILLVGLAIIIIADTTYTVGAALGTYESGGLSDIFEGLAYAIVGIAALVAVDVQRPQAPATDREA